MSQEEKYYTREEMDVLMEKHIERNAEILRKDLEKVNKESEVIEYA